MLIRSLPGAQDTEDPFELQLIAREGNFPDDSVEFQVLSSLLKYFQACRHRRSFSCFLEGH